MPGPEVIAWAVGSFGAASAMSWRTRRRDATVCGVLTELCRGRARVRLARERNARLQAAYLALPPGSLLVEKDAGGAEIHLYGGHADRRARRADVPAAPALT